MKTDKLALECDDSGVLDNRLIPLHLRRVGGGTGGASGGVVVPAVALEGLADNKFVYWPSIIEFQSVSKVSEVSTKWQPGQMIVRSALGKRNYEC